MPLAALQGKAPDSAWALDYAVVHHQEFLEELEAWLRIPSISALSSHRGDILKAVNFASERLQGLGFRTEIWQTQGQPSLFAERLEDKYLPTLLIYGHLDVQPVDPLDQWKHPPFEPWVEGNRLYGRGSADDKGQTMIHIKACESWIKTAGRLPLNVKFIIEGEEEVGSPYFADLLKRYENRLSSDVTVVSDTSMAGKDHPSITYSTRGLIYYELLATGPGIDLHSGGFGGAVRNPLLALSQILSAMVDKKGKVTIPGFYQGVAPLNKEEKKWARRVKALEKEWARAAGVSLAGGETGISAIERVWSRPTFEVHGLSGGFQGEGSKTIIPQSAMAKVSMRLVPHQDVEAVARSFERCAARLAPKGVKIVIRRLPGGGPAFLEDVKQPAFEAALSSLQEAFKKEAVFIRSGGSIFACDLFKRAFPKVPVVLMGFGLPDENAHAPNEWLDLDNFQNGITACALFYERFAKAARVG
ncbi:MAG: dipeptidase [Elusimicrobia bacterium]|nr:dipeptidase [Elusimicrobiota bacterium]